MALDLLVLGFQSLGEVYLLELGSCCIFSSLCLDLGNLTHLEILV